MVPILVLCLLLGGIALFLKARKKPKQVWETTPGGPYEVVFTGETLSCVHPSRPREVISWNEIKEVYLVTTSDGPFLPDEWYVFVGDGAGVSIPSEAKGFNALWEEFKVRFPDLDYAPIIEAGTDDERRLLWKKQGMADNT